MMRCEWEMRSGLAWASCCRVEVTWCCRWIIHFEIEIIPAFIDSWLYTSSALARDAQEMHSWIIPWKPVCLPCHWRGSTLPHPSTRMLYAVEMVKNYWISGIKEYSVKAGCEYFDAPLPQFYGLTLPHFGTGLSLAILSSSKQCLLCSHSVGILQCD